MKKNWKYYFKVVGMVPGNIFHPDFGKVDLSSNNLPVEKIQKMFETHLFPLQLTEEGQKELYTKQQPQDIKFIDLDIDSQDYTTLKELRRSLELETEDNKADTLKKALKAHQQELKESL